MLGVYWKVLVYKKWLKVYFNYDLFVYFKSSVQIWLYVFGVYCGVKQLYFIFDWCVVLDWYGLE